MFENSKKVESSSSPSEYDEPNPSEAGSANAPLTRPPGVHRVCLPPRQTSVQKLRRRLLEIFFPDDPLHRFKDQTWFRRLVTGLQCSFPILKWAPHYSFKLLKCDVCSGVTIASLAIPQGISYAKLANLPPIIGLYSSFVPPLIYSVLGSSHHLAVGPVSIASLVMGTMLSEAVSYTSEPALYLKLAFTSTFFAGLFQASLGFLRLGFIIDFLSKATLVGFMAGAAIIVSLQQLKGLLGIVHFTSKMQIIPVLSSVFNHRNEWSWQTIIIGVSFLALLLTTRHIIGQLPKGLNPPSARMLLFTGGHLALTIKTGITTGVLSLTEGIAVGRTFAALKNYQVNGNKEMMAIGLMNIAGSCSSCYITTGSFSRSAVNYNAGAQSGVSNIIMAVAVLITLLFLMPLFHYTPNLILAAIIITAAVGLIDYEAAYKLWKVDKLDFVACLCSFFGVLFISVALGLAIAVGISVFKILLNVTRPNTVSLGNIPGTQIYQNLSRYTQAVRVPSFLILGIEAPIYFANSTYLQERLKAHLLLLLAFPKFQLISDNQKRNHHYKANENHSYLAISQKSLLVNKLLIVKLQVAIFQFPQLRSIPHKLGTQNYRILRWIREEEQWLASNDICDLRCVILDMTAVTAIDTSGLDMISELRKMLDNRSLKLVLANPVGSVMEKLHKSNVLELFHFEGLYLTVGEAVSDISSSWKDQP
ncbi:UNVERIFIED_CONTAM: putative sulfate transporter 3.4 [Sesamum radiatum]|uniref:Sulfate transporter 3.4 n=1 Tax=Sesamum radiatum TaxID=300843 RepID=A0AAW2VM39_SESRA